MALGPLTNLALAVRLDPCFPQKLKDLYVMGGNMEGETMTVVFVFRRYRGKKRKQMYLFSAGKGNVTLCAEFNFAMDPESAYVVLEEFLCQTYVATWEFACRNMLPWVSFAKVNNLLNLLKSNSVVFI